MWCITFFLFPLSLFLHQFSLFSSKELASPSHFVLLHDSPHLRTNLSMVLGCKSLATIWVIGWMFVVWGTLGILEMLKGLEGTNRFCCGAAGCGPHRGCRSQGM